MGLLFRAGQRSGRAAMSETSFPVAIWHRAATACHYGEEADWGEGEQQHSSWSSWSSWSKQPANAMICTVLRVKTTRETQI